MEKKSGTKVIKLNKTNEEKNKEIIIETFDEVKKLVEKGELKGFVFGAYRKDGEMILTSTETQSTLEDYAIACFMQNFFANDLTLSQMMPLMQFPDEGEDE